MEYEIEVKTRQFNSSPYHGVGLPSQHTLDSAKPPGRIELKKIAEMNRRFENSHPDEIIQWGAEAFGNKVVLGTGFGPSGIFLIHRLVTNKIPLKVFYLDTQLLFEETYRLRDEIEQKFSIEVERVSTNLSVKEQAEVHGDELWKSNPDRCCYIRKVLPLKKYLNDKEAWITGVRRNQAETRLQTDIIEWDPFNEVVKLNPLARWERDDVWAYIDEHQLPYNPLHDDGFPTIGCLPCTAPSDTIEDERSGRWKNTEKTECGIHLPAQKFKNSDA